MRRAVLLIVGLFLIVLVLGMAVGQWLVVGQRIAHVSGVAGQVTAALPKGGEAALIEGANVVAGTQITTGPAGTVTLNWMDGTRVRVGANTIMTVLQCQINNTTKAETSLFKLDAGEILVRVRKLLSGQSKFEIQTPTATAGVRGTVFAVRVESGKTEVEVFEGQVKVDSSTGQELEVSPGRKAETSTDKAAVEDLSPAEQATWAKEQGQMGPYLAVTAPQPGEKVAAGTPVEVKGRVEQGAQVVVNGQPVHVRGTNRFTTTLAAPAGGGKLAVTVVAKDARGYETKEVREVNVGQ